jgi:uncharacterized protein YpmS
MTKYSSNLAANAKKSGFRPWSKKISFILLGLLFIGAAVVYMGEINAVSAKGFAIRDLQKKINQIKADNEKLEANLVEKQSITYLASKVSELKMVEATEVSFIDSSASALARR